MNEKTLFILAVTGSLIGILIIIFISDSIEIKQTNISDITEKYLNKEIKITAQITKIHITSGLYILTLDDNTSEIKAIIFKDENLDFKNYDRVEITGEVVKYKNTLEIQVNELKTI